MTQRQFDFNRASKLNTLECVVLTANVKSLLKALDGFARDAAHCTVTLKRVALSMGVSTRTAQRVCRQAEAEGLLIVSGCPEDGQSNTYAIQWGVIFNLPTGAGPKRRAKSPSPPTPLPGVPGRGEIENESHVTPDRLSPLPRQVVTPPLSDCQGTPDRLSGVLCTDHTDKETATIDQRENQTAGGGGLRVPPSAYGPPRSGSWAWTVTRSELGEQATVVALFNAAVKAGLLANAQLDQIRFLALTKKIRAEETIKNPTGYLVRIVETGGWNYLPPDAVRKAWQQLRPGQPPPTGEQLTKLRTSGAAILQRTNDQ